MVHEPLNVTMAGELDCGKSTLIGRLLLDTNSLSKEKKQELSRSRDTNFAHLLDSLSEERNGQFTLDTTQAFIRTRKRHYILIDVPGHRELLKNMLTGSSHAEAAIVVID
ncbi:MAG: 50S ribosome-binding GTPase, partial [Candidatus Omnitrophica bacterium]|nr:50S ribosome-binding GTPase [Candidatus Omnitrophota bacterium]